MPIAIRKIALNCRHLVQSRPSFKEPMGLVAAANTKEAKNRREKWVDFVRQKRIRWEPSKSSVKCSKNFIPDKFVCNYTYTNDQELIGATIEYRSSRGVS